MEKKQTTINKTDAAAGAFMEVRQAAEKRGAGLEFEQDYIMRMIKGGNSGPCTHHISQNKPAV